MEPRSFWLCVLRRSTWLRNLAAATLTGTTLLMSLYAEIPDWWVSRGVLKPGELADNAAALNAGQFKHAVSQAVAETNVELAAEGGAGMELNNLVASWINEGSGVDNYEVVNVGQIKAVLKLWYDRLNEVHGTTGYPWGAVDNDENYEAVNLGQLKKLLRLDVRLPWTHNLAQGWTFPGSLDNLDFDDDGLSHSQELLLGLNPFNPDSDGDLIEDGDELALGSDPSTSNWMPGFMEFTHDDAGRLIGHQPPSQAAAVFLMDSEGNVRTAP